MMAQVSHVLNSIGNAIELFLGSAYFVVELALYLPMILSSAVIVFLACYFIRFWLGK